jgi:hypothetical protein
MGIRGLTAGRIFEMSDAGRCVSAYFSYENRAYLNQSFMLVKYESCITQRKLELKYVTYEYLVIINTGGN